MKKIIVLLLAVALVFSACGTVPAEETVARTATEVFATEAFPTSELPLREETLQVTEVTHTQPISTEKQQTLAVSTAVETTAEKTAKTTQTVTAEQTTLALSTTVKPETTKAETTAVQTTAVTEVPKTQPVTSAPEEKCGIILGTKNVRFGCGSGQITAAFGEPSQTVTETLSDGTVIKSLIYASDYRRFCVFQLRNSSFAAFYTVADDAIATDGKNSFSINAGGSRSFGEVEIRTFTEPSGSVYAFYASYGGFAYSPRSLKNLDAQEALIFHTTNALRAINGVPALKKSDKAEGCIRNHCEDMAENDYLAHESLDGRQPHERASDAGIDYRACGENLYSGNSLAFAIADGWYNSSGHRKNLLDRDYEYIGIAAVHDSDYIKAGQLFFS